MNIMARQTYADVSSNNTNSNSDGYKVGFFNIKDGEEAIVRFVLNSVDDFDIYTVHPITVGQSSYSQFYVRYCESKTHREH